MKKNEKLTIGQRLMSLLNRKARDYYAPTQQESNDALKQSAEKTDNSIKILTLSENSLNYYRKHVKGNADISEDMAARKMSRNILLSIPYKRDSKAKKSPRVWYSYGNLCFIVKDEKVIWIKNNCRPLPMWYKDVDKYNELNKLLEIDKKYIK